VASSTTTAIPTSSSTASRTPPSGRP
jgi:hypothetical protein